MSLIGFRSGNHPQQIARHGAKDHIDDRGTDPALFARLSERFGGFTLDVAASAENAKCSRYFTKEDDGLTQHWDNEKVWCNPPYSSIGPWIRKAWFEAHRCDLIVMLLPANRCEQSWWQSEVEPFRDRKMGLSVEFLAGRTRFVNVGKPGIGPNERPPFGCCLLIWRR